MFLWFSFSRIYLVKREDYKLLFLHSLLKVKTLLTYFDTIPIHSSGYNGLIILYRDKVKEKKKGGLYSN